MEQFRGLRGDIELLALGSYFAELLEAVSDEDCPEPEILQLGLNGLYALASGMFPPEQVKAAFELRQMCLSGYRPELEGCAKCGKVDIESGYLVPAHGELYCEDCPRPDGLPVDRAVIEAMRYIVDAAPKRIFSFRLDDEGIRRLGQVCEAYALYELDRGFASLDYYKKVRNSK